MPDLASAPAYTAPGYSPVANGRPIGPVHSACPAFTRWRLRNRLSTAIVARLLSACGVSTSDRAVRGWEIGTYRPSERRIDRLAQLAGTPAECVASWFGVGLGTDDARVPHV